MHAEEQAPEDSYELISNLHPTLHAHIVDAGASPGKMVHQGARALYAILELAGLDKDTATTKDLDDYGYIKWIDHKREFRLQAWKWRDLVRLGADRFFAEADSQAFLPLLAGLPPHLQPRVQQEQAHDHSTRRSQAGRWF